MTATARETADDRDTAEIEDACDVDVLIIGAGVSASASHITCVTSSPTGPS